MKPISKERTPSYGKVPLAVVVGNEDAAHHTMTALFRALLEVGFSGPLGGPAYWVSVSKHRRQ